MRSVSCRVLFAILFVTLTPALLSAHDVTITGTQSFSSLDGSSSDHDGTANGVFTVNDGNLVVNGVVNCNDDTTESACSMAFAVSGNLVINSGGALYAENRSGSGSGGAITLTVGGNLALNGTAIVSTASRSSSGSGGGAITANVGGTVALASGTTIDSGSSNAAAGAINVAAGSTILVDGNVLAGPSRTILSTKLTGLALDGGTANQVGGAITIGSTTFAEPALVVGTNANIISQGDNNGAGPVTLDACGIQVRGLVAALSRKDSAARVRIRSGKDVLVDGRDLGATGLRMGRVRADAPTGSAINKGVDIFAKETIDLYGPGGSLYVITSLPGLHDAKSYGGLVRITSLEEAVNGSGNLIDDGHTASGDTGGTVQISAKGDVNLNTAVIRAEGDFNTNNANRGGGTVTVRSYSGNVIWTNGTGDVRPVGSSSGLPLADQGSIVLTACGTVTTTGSTFPVNGTATSMHPETHTGVCSPGAPSLPTGTPPLVTCNTPPVANDTAASTNEDTTVTVFLSGTDADGDSLTFTIVSGPANGVLGSVISTGPTTATVDYTPYLNYNGGDSFVFQANDGNGGTDQATATITIAPVNDPPSFLIGPDMTRLEDSGAQTVTNWVTAISPGPADESGQTVTFTTSNNNSSLFSIQPVVASDGTLTFTLAANAYGSATISVVAQDNGGTLNGGDDTSNAQTATITITPVNDEPSFVKGADQTVSEDAGAQTVSNWATAISAGPNESGQTLTFVTSSTNSALFSAQPAVSSSGTLTYTPAANANGSATVTVYLTDDGGTDNGGDNASPAQTFTITVNSVNDAPSFTSGGNVTRPEDSAAYSASWASDISAGPSDENGQTVAFNTSNDNNALFASQPSISSTGVLTFTPAANQYGSATVTVTLSDNGGTINGGSDTSAAQTFVITLTPVNDEPSFASGGNVTVNEDSGAYSAAWATAISAGPNESGQTVTFVTSNNNNALFSAQPAVASDGTLTYTPAANATGSATVTVYLTDDGGTDNGGDNTSPSQTFTITVNAVNDAPSFTGGGNVTVLEDSGAYSASWASDISAGPSDENGQTVTFNTSNDNNALFASQPSISSTGVLTFTPAANQYGSATVTVTLSDNGGTINGGSDTSAAQTFVITLTPVNDEPSFASGGNVTVNEDSGAYSAAWATAISAGPNESGQTVTFVTSNDNNALFSVQPSVSSSGVLSFTPATNAFGSATVTVHLTDDGGTDNGGDNTSPSQTFTITVNSVNDAPSFTSGGNVSVAEDSGAYSAAWATGISAGPANESGQTVTFVTANNNNALFTVQPSVSSSGVLSFTVAANVTGSATVTIYAQDDGGTANGGVNTSASQTFSITVNDINDEPTFTPGGNQTSNEDAGPQSVVWATNISAGPANESGQTVTFFVSNDNNALFSAQPAINSSGTLTYTAAPNANGTATVTVYAQDNGGTANGGDDTSATYTFTITVNAVNDEPSFTSGGNVTVNEDSGAYSVAWATAISAGPANESGQTVTFNIVSNSNPSLFASGPSISSTGVLAFTPAANAFGSATIVVNLQDDGGTANFGDDTSANSTFTITVNAVNDAPSFTPGGDVTVNEDSGLYSQTWATSISAGPNESGQTVTFNVTNDNNALFLVQPSISSSGVLTFTSNLNAHGSATVTVFAQDNGGTANFGVDTSASVQFTITVTPVNDAPTAGADAWDTLGNTELRVDFAGGLTPKVVDTTPSGNGVRDNDSDPEGDPFVVTGIVGCSDVSTPYDCTLGDGSKVSMLANGSFSYTPGPGNTTGSFQYTITDTPSFGSPASATGTVTITIYDRIWYVNGSAAAGGNGTSVAPFNNFASLSGAGDVDAAGDTIFVHTSAVTGSIVMEASQKLHGEGVGLKTNQNLNGNGSPQVLVAPGVKPTVASGSNTVSVDGVAGVDIAGLSLSSTAGNAIDVNSNGASPATSVTIHDNTITAAAQEGIDVNATATAGTTVLVNNTSITSAGHGFDVTSNGPTVMAYTNGTIASTGGSGIRADGSGSGNLTVLGLSNVTIDGITAGDGISINTANFDAVAGGSFNTVSGGTISVGASGNPVGGAGVVLTNVSGDYTLTSLTVFAGTSGVTVGGSGLFSGAAGMRISNAGGSISAPAGHGLSVTNATIGTGGLNFTSIASANASNGIVLNNTGSTAGLTVTGTGSAGSGGTIQNITNRGASFVSAVNISLSWMNFTNANTADGANSDGVVGGSENTDENGALHFQSVAGVDLDRLQISGASQHGINGNNVTDLDISNTTINTTGNEVWESGIYLFHLKGLSSAGRTNVFNNVTISNSGQFNMLVLNASGTNAAPGEKDRLELTNCTFNSSGVNVIGDQVSIFNSVTANFQSVVSGCTFNATAGRTSDNIQVDASGNARADTSISGSTFTNAGQASINLSGSGTGQQTFSVTNNPTVSVRAGDSVNVAANGSSSLSGTIANNNLSTSVANNPAFGIDMVVDSNGSIVADVNGNTITGHSVGIRGGARGGTGTANLTIRNNVVTSGGSNEFAGVWFFAGAGVAGETNSLCLNLVSNQVDITTGAGYVDYYLEQFAGTTFRLQGLSGSGTTASNVEAFVAGTDTDPSPTDPTVDVSGGGTVNYTSGTCASP